MNKINPYVIIDFETGGVDPKLNPVTEFAGICVDGDTFNQVASYETLFNYYSELEYTEGAIKATGITHEIISTGAKFKDAMTGIIDFFEKSKIHGNSAQHKPILVGHNITFDIGFLQQIFAYAKKDMSKYFQGKEDYFGNFQPMYLDTLLLSRFKWGNDETMPNYKLETCIEKADLELNDAHRAMNDVKATVELLSYFGSNIRSNGSSTESVKTRIRDYFRF